MQTLSTDFRTSFSCPQRPLHLPKLQRITITRFRQCAMKWHARKHAWN